MQKNRYSVLEKAGSAKVLFNYSEIKAEKEDQHHEKQKNRVFDQLSTYLPSDEQRLEEKS